MPNSETHTVKLLPSAELSVYVTGADKPIARPRASYATESVAVNIETEYSESRRSRGRSDTMEPAESIFTHTLVVAALVYSTDTRPCCMAALRADERYDRNVTVVERSLSFTYALFIDGYAMRRVIAMIDTMLMQVAAPCVF